ncbi:LPP20 family lipoprotein [Sulfurimonas sp. SAG-AH-194-C20]|nr:LPP20 family lipoprotein [Sulfurimonas sp. SAG-AH-194-C20]MDF1878258.1 LPP20 family lipoprotein [Sulfurimonas sp. SAG-AH-194-C20]
MKNSIISISAATLLVATLVGCGGETPKPQEPVNNFACKQENVLAPKWTCLPMIEGAYAGVGISEKSRAGMAHMRKVAQMNGRSDLAQQIKVQVKSRMKGFTQTTGAADSETVDKMTQAVDDQMAKVDLAGSKAVDIWTSPSGSIYMLMTVPEDYINKTVNETAKTSFKNDNALWQQFQAAKAFDAMDAALAN